MCVAAGQVEQHRLQHQAAVQTPKPGGGANIASTKLIGDTQQLPCSHLELAEYH